MDQYLGELAFAPEGPGSVPSTPPGAPGPRNLEPLFWPPWAQARWWHTFTHTYLKININSKLAGSGGGASDPNPWEAEGGGSSSRRLGAHAGLGKHQVCAQRTDKPEVRCSDTKVFFKSNRGVLIQSEQGWTQ